MPIVPAPASTAGIVNTPVPTMLPTTSPVADVRPKVWAFFSLRADMAGSGGRAEPGGSGGLEDGGDSAMVIRLTFVLVWRGTALPDAVLVGNGERTPGRGSSAFTAGSVTRRCSSQVAAHRMTKRLAHTAGAIQMAALTGGPLVRPDSNRFGPNTAAPAGHDGDHTVSLRSCPSCSRGATAKSGTVAVAINVASATWMTTSPPPVAITGDNTTDRTPLLNRSAMQRRRYPGAGSCLYTAGVVTAAGTPVAAGESP